MKKNIFVYALIIAAVALTGCNNYLTPDNKTAGGQTAEQYFSENPDALLTYAYYLSRNLVWDGEKTANMMCDGTDLYQPSRNQSATEFLQYSLNAENSDVEAFYKAAYSCINNANAAIYYAEMKNGSDKVIAEARFIRSWCYFMLTQNFGGVPYILTYVNDANRAYPREELKKIYDGIIEDLNAAIAAKVLDETSTDGRANVAACYALRAKVNLAAGWDLEVSGDGLSVASTGTTYFAAAIASADTALEISGNKEFSLTSAEKWAPATAVNKEVLFAIQWSREGNPGEDATSGHGLQNTFGNYYGDCTTTGLKYVNSRLAPTPKALLLWEEGDQRYEATFMTQMANYNGEDYAWGSHGYYGYYNNAEFAKLNICFKYFPAWTSEEDAKAWINAHADQFKQITGGANNPTAYIMSDPVKVISINADGTAGSVTEKPYAASIQNDMNFCPPVKKWDDPASIQLALTKANSYRPVPVLHASDLHLLMAEAYLMSNKEGKALEALNKVRKRAGVSELPGFEAYEAPYTVPGSYTEGKIDLILDERAREMYAECVRWMDLRRTRQLVRYNKAFNTFLTGTVKTYRPIPQTEINSNSAMTLEDQNPGY